MADRKRHGNLESIVLRFDKRRYDGGPEMELIRYIEHSQVKAAVDHGLSRPVPTMVATELPGRETKASRACRKNGCQGQCRGNCTCGSSCTLGLTNGCTSACKQPCAIHGRTATHPSHSVALEPVKLSRKQMMIEALILGPMEIAVGSVGILTSTLAVFTFFQLNNRPMALQSKQVLGECIATLFKGVVDTAVSPFSLLRAVFVGA